MLPADYPRAITSAIIATTLVLATFALLSPPPVAVLTGVVGGLTAAWLRWRWADMSIGAVVGLLVGAGFHARSHVIEERVEAVQAFAMHAVLDVALAAAFTAAILAAAWWGAGLARGKMGREVQRSSPPAASSRLRVGTSAR